LAEAGVAHQAGRRLAPKQLDQPFAKLQTASLAAVWAAADHHVAGWHRSSSVCRIPNGWAAHNLKRSERLLLRPRGAQ
jgi:hypothetical protein